MKSRLLLPLLFLPNLASAATVVFDFDDANGIVDSNDFGTGVTVSNVTLVSGGGTAFQNSRAEMGARSTPVVTASFTITINSAVTVDLSTLSFVHGFDNNFGTNTLTPNYSLTFSQGSGTNTVGSLPTSTSTDYEQSASVTSLLSGLTGLNDTSVTFTWTFSNTEGRANGVGLRSHFLDNIVLTGTAVVPEPTAALLGGIGMLTLLRRRRR